jgi:hypothetical protein
MQENIDNQDYFVQEKHPLPVYKAAGAYKTGNL